MKRKVKALKGLNLARKEKPFSVPFRSYLTKRSIIQPFPLKIDSPSKTDNLLLSALGRAKEELIGDIDKCPIQFMCGYIHYWSKLKELQKDYFIPLRCEVLFQETLGIFEKKLAELNRLSKKKSIQGYIASVMIQKNNQLGHNSIETLKGLYEKLKEQELNDFIEFLKNSLSIEGLELARIHRNLPIFSCANHSDGYELVSLLEIETVEGYLLKIKSEKDNNDTNLKERKRRPVKMRKDDFAKDLCDLIGSFNSEVYITCDEIKVLTDIVVYHKKPESSLQLDVYSKFSQFLTDKAKKRTFFALLDDSSEKCKGQTISQFSSLAQSLQNLFDNTAGFSTHNLLRFINGNKPGKIVTSENVDCYLQIKNTIKHNAFSVKNNRIRKIFYQIHIELSQI